MTFHATVLTLFPEMFPGPLGLSVIGRALQQGSWTLDARQIRDHATDKHRTVDDTPYGGGDGMVMRADVLDAAIVAAEADHPAARLVYLTPRGTPLSQSLAADLSAQSLILLCGRYEGIDERVLTHHRPLEISIGDYVLAGGELAAMVLLEACVRLLPGVLGADGSSAEESFAKSGDCAGLLEYPHYTKPPSWNGLDVPEILLSGHHRNISEWRKQQAQALTEQRRPDMWARYTNNGEEPKS